MTPTATAFAFKATSTDLQFTQFHSQLVPRINLGRETEGGK